jgi:hypothetical protein
MGMLGSRGSEMDPLLVETWDLAILDPSNLGQSNNFHLKLGIERHFVL